MSPAVAAIRVCWPAITSVARNTATEATLTRAAYSSSSSIMAANFPGFGLVKYLRERQKPVVSVLELHGIIAPQMGGAPSPFSAGQKRLNLSSLRKSIDESFSPNKLEAVILSVNSPGGSAAQSELIAQYIQDKAREKSVSVTTFVEDYAASGGYWLACAGSNIYVTKSSVVGSIGVISASFGFPELMSRVGVERRVFTSGASKSVMDPFLPVKETDLAILKVVLEGIHAGFKDAVKCSRGDRIKTSDEARLFSGEFWPGEQSVQLGLADGVQTIDAYLKSNFGERVRVKRATQVSPFMQLMGAKASPSLSAEELLSVLRVEEVEARFRVK